ncbi:MAG TPA: hypothetical protein VJ917_07900 [Saprospiraceae bacterium]|nr:hypothetical protein [Saprospiraceae bacterium]
MHDIEPYFKWREKYIASEDKQSPFHGRAYSEFYFTNKIYNFVIHPQWDDFGSPTLYLKVLYVNYDLGVMMIELLGEWNDAINNDIMILRQELIDTAMDCGIKKFLFFCDNLLNFHGSDDAYYEDWFEHIEHGWICLLNTHDHVSDEMVDTRINYFVHLGELFNGVFWQKYSPEQVLLMVESQIKKHYNKELI